MCFLWGEGEDRRGKDYGLEVLAKTPGLYQVPKHSRLEWPIRGGELPTSLFKVFNSIHMWQIVQNPLNYERNLILKRKISQNQSFLSCGKCCNIFVLNKCVPIKSNIQVIQTDTYLLSK